MRVQAAEQALVPMAQLVVAADKAESLFSSCLKSSFRRALVGLKNYKSSSPH